MGGFLRRWLEMIRFSHTVFALPFALLSAVLAWTAGARSEPPVIWRWQELAGILICMVGARSAAMAFNRIADRHFDARNPRTANRHIPAGEVSVLSAALFAGISGFVFVLGTLCFWPNPLPLYLALPVLIFLGAYSFTKRFTVWSHFWLGTALMLAPLCTWIAIRGPIVSESPIDMLPALLLGGAVLMWVAGFDLIYACQDSQFDRESGLRSIPARWGVTRALRLASVCHLGTIVLLALLPQTYDHLGAIYWVGVIAAGLLLAYEHAIVRPDDLTRVNVAFFQVNAVVSMGLLVVVSFDLWW